MLHPLYTLARAIKVFVILLGIVTICCGNTQAQELLKHLPAEIIDILNKQTLVPSTPGAGVPGMQSRMYARPHYQYKPTQTGFVFIDSSHYEYSGGRGGDALTTPKYDNCITVAVDPNGIRSTTLYTSVYDQYDNATRTTIENLDAGTGNWIPFSYNRAAISRYNYRLSDTNYIWQPWSQSYVAEVSWSYGHFSSDGRLAAAACYEYHPDTLAWDNVPQLGFLLDYDANLNIIEFSTYVYIDKWGTALNYLYTYNAQNRLTSLKRKSWYTIPPPKRWETFDSTYYSYDGSGLRDAEVYMKFNRTMWRFDTIGRYSFTYDAAGNLAESIYHIYDAANKVYRNEDKFTYTYNNYNQCTSKRSQSWVNGAWDNSGRDHINNYYYQLYFPVGVTNVSNNNTQLQLWPVPANNILYIQPTEKATQNYTLCITDMMGRKVLQQNQTGNAMSADVSSLPVGSYNIMLYSNGIVQHSKFNIIR
jgi:hypothetical protein